MLAAQVVGKRHHQNTSLAVYTPMHMIAPINVDGTLSVGSGDEISIHKNAYHRTRQSGQNDERIQP